MAKKKRATRTEEGPTEVTNFFTEAIEKDFDDLPEERIEQTIQILTSFVEKRGADQKEVVKVLKEELAKTSERASAEDRYGAALISTRRKFKRGKKPAENVECIVIGMQNSPENNGKRRINELEEDYDSLSKQEQKDVEIGLENYTSIIKRSRKIKDDGEKSEFLQKELNGAYMVYDDTKDIPEKDLKDDFFIENIHTWGTGSVNFAYGEKLSDILQREMIVLIKGNNKKWTVQGVRVKGKDSVQIVSEARLNWPSTIKVVIQKDTRWWNDQAAENFSITPMSEADGLAYMELKSMGEVDSWFFKKIKAMLPKAQTITVDKSDEWQRKRKSDKKSQHCIIEGIVEDIVYWEDESCQLILVPQNVNIFESFKFEAEDDEYNDMEQAEVRIQIGTELAATIDFDRDTKLFVYADLYRMKIKDDDGNKTKKDEPNPRGNGWAFVADPKLKTERANPQDVSSDTITPATADADEDDEEDDFEIED